LVIECSSARVATRLSGATTPATSAPRAASADEWQLITTLTATTNGTNPPTSP
jgi:hypothetical protein